MKKTASAMIMALATTLFTPAPTLAEDLYVMSSGGFTAALKQLAPGYEAASGNKIVLSLGASMGATPTAIPNRLAKGEPGDVVFMVGYALDALIKDGKVLADSRKDVAFSKIGMAVRKGTPKPDISSLEAFKTAMRNAKSVAWSDSASGVYLSKEVFPRLGLAEMMKDKGRTIEGDPVGGVVSKGDFEVGFQQISELLPWPELELLGELPGEVQKVTVFSAGVVATSKHPDAARALIAAMTAPETIPVMVKTGLEPPK